jgi:sphingomyelin phosphodiesterase acid-like 3
MLLFPVISNASLNNKENNFLVISDIHLDQASTHPMEISPIAGKSENDLDSTTFTKLISDLNKNIQNGTVSQPKFIIIQGDIVGHERASSNSVIEDESAVFNIIKQNFPTTPIFYTFGNNDSLDADYGPFKSATQSGQYTSPYDVAKLNAGWANGFLSTGTQCKKETTQFPCLIKEDATNGYYSAYIDNKFRMISLNSVLFSPRRTHITETDALNQLQWLETQLNEARANNESVLITMHVPPGNNIYNHSSFWLPKEQTAFLKIVESYQDIIVGLLASHTHSEELKSIQDSSRKNIIGVYLVAALSTSHGNEPSVKTFYFSKNNTQWRLSNYEAFHFTMDNSNLVFNKLYDYKNYYCTNNENDLTECLSNVTADKMKKFYSAGNPNYNGAMKSPDDIVLPINAI